MSTIDYAALAIAAVAGYHVDFGSRPSRGEVVYLIAVGQLESHWGDDYRTDGGASSHNWGTIQWRGLTLQERAQCKLGELRKGSIVQGGILWGDIDPDKGAYPIWLRRFDTPAEGAACLATTLYKGNPLARKAASDGAPAVDVAREMYRHGYYQGAHAGARAAFDRTGRPTRTDPMTAPEEANVQAYAAGLRKCVNEIVGALPELGWSTFDVIQSSRLPIVETPAPNEPAAVPPCT